MCEEWILYYVFGMTGQPITLYHIYFGVELYQKVSIVGPCKLCNLDKKYIFVSILDLMCLGSIMWNSVHVFSSV
jgi:hypothetical protein